jgi:hypothetical protein
MDAEGCHAGSGTIFRQPTDIADAALSLAADFYVIGTDRNLTLIELLAVFTLPITTSSWYAVILRYFGTSSAFVIGVIDISIFGMKRLDCHSDTS